MKVILPTSRAAGAYPNPTRNPCWLLEAGGRLHVLLRDRSRSISRAAGLRDTGKPIDRSTVYHRYRKSRDRANITKVPFHGLRHTYGTVMAEAGTPVRTLQEWMGHQSFQTTLIYADYTPGEREAEIVERASSGSQSGHKLNSSEHNSDQVDAVGLGSD
jgi:integrase